MYWKVAAGDLPRWYTLRFEDNAFYFTMQEEVFSCIMRSLGDQSPAIRLYQEQGVLDPDVYMPPGTERWGVDGSVETQIKEGDAYTLRVPLRSYSDPRYFASAQSLSLIFGVLDLFDSRTLKNKKPQLLGISAPSTLPREEVYGFSVGINTRLRALFSEYYFYPMRGSIQLCMSGAAEQICERELFPDEYCAVSWDNEKNVTFRSGYGIIGPRRNMGDVISVCEWDTLNVDDYLTHMTLLAGIFHLYQLALEEEAVDEGKQQHKKAPCA